MHKDIATQSIFPKLFKLIEGLERNREIFLLSFYASVGLVLICFLLLCFPVIEQFFGENQVLFYLLFFLPLGFFVLAFFVLFIMGAVFYLVDEYHLKRSQGESLYKIILRLILHLLIIFIILAVIIESGGLSWSKEDTTTMSKKK